LRRGPLALQLAIIGIAAALAVLPLPHDLVERYYSDAFYPALQARLTSWSNKTGYALFDVILLFVIGVPIVLGWRASAGAMRQRSIQPLLRGLIAMVTMCAGVFLWFALAWGLNYSRSPLEDGIGYDRQRVTRDAVAALAERSIVQTNRLYAPGHSHGFPAADEMPPSLVAALHDVEHRLGRPRPTIAGRPKRTLLGWFFRAAGVDGMHAPFMLETLLNPDLTPPERPAVLAHEWAHLAGFAPEDDASFVGILAAMRADDGARYSAWLTLAFDATNQLPRTDRQRLLDKLDEGPKRDQQAIFDRLKMRIEPVEQVSWQTYDRYLKSQGVAEGVGSYSRVVQLLVGSGALDW
jgi:Protein of unknown function (DUF3810)